MRRALFPLGLCIIANSVLKAHIAGVDSAVPKSGPIGKMVDLDYNLGIFLGHIADVVAQETVAELVQRGEAS